MDWNSARAAESTVTLNDPQARLIETGEDSSKPAVQRRRHPIEMEQPGPLSTARLIPTAPSS
jgi:hypothetical protein